MKKQLTYADKIAILQDKYNTLEDTDYKKIQLWSRIERMKLKTKVFWAGSKGTYKKPTETAE